MTKRFCATSNLHNAVALKDGCKNMDLVEIISIFDNIVDEMANEGDNPSYPRLVEIYIPDEVSPIMDVGCISVPVRDALTWFAAFHPDNAELVTNLRDEFYSDYEEDYVGPDLSPSQLLMRHEQVAETKYEWSNRRPKTLTYPWGQQFGNPFSDVGAKGEYPHHIKIEMPTEAAILFGIMAIELPVENILHWLIISHPEHTKHVTEIRRALFSNHAEDKQEPRIVLIDSGVATPEQVDEVKRVWAEKRPGMLLDRARLQTEIAQEDAVEAAMWAPFAAERAALEAEQVALDCRADDLDEKWYHFVAERENWGEERSQREPAVREQLIQQGKALCVDQDALAERQRELRMSVSQVT